MPDHADLTNLDDASQPPSKSRRKLDMLELQKLGVRLCALDARRLGELNLPERLLDAINAVRTITAHEGRRRQMQYIGRLMRDVEIAPLQAALARHDEMPRAEKLRFAALERWRDRILNEDSGMADYLAAHPDAPQMELATLAHAARAERAAGAPPHKFRELFRRLKAIDDAAPK
jgi:ribosome-associated protein